MQKGKIIVIEGTDGSGKRTQAKLLYERLISEKVPCKMMSFPRYDTPTGKIISECYLGKEKSSWFHDPPKLNPKIASLYYAADRLAAKEEMELMLNSGTNLILDRYVESNMAHQGGKLPTMEREEFVKFIEELEYGLLKMQKPDAIIFLHMPTKFAVGLREKRGESPDAHESDANHLLNAEQAYIELAKKPNWIKINCVSEKGIKTPDEIHVEICREVRKLFHS